jgi:hypothetical protein
MRMDLAPGREPIFFEGQALSPWAKCIDTVGAVDQLSDAGNEWLLDVQYCWGRTRTAPGPNTVQRSMTIDCRNGLLGWGQ